jgi:hypothetical protein
LTELHHFDAAPAASALAQLKCVTVSQLLWKAQKLTEVLELFAAMIFNDW